jgi:hypothetical protein
MLSAATTPTVAQAEVPQEEPKCELADIFRLHGEDYRRAHRLPSLHLEVMRAVEDCRTAALGGHVERCDACGFERISYNSCRNRHCPKCQATTKARWLEARKADLLPVGYFHVVFTLPHEINPIAEALENKKVIYDLLFRSSAETLKEFGANPRNRLGGKIGFTALLHTWDQQLRTHIHLHCVVPGGALSFDGQRWIPVPNENYLFNVEALSVVFRAKFIEGLKGAFALRQITFPQPISHFGAEEGFRRLTDRLWEKDWIAYAKKPFAGPEKVLDYLGRYTHRVAISNHRILHVEDDRVTFRYRDRSDGDKLKQSTLPAHEFIRRFLLHALPKGYVRIRHFGFLASRSKAGNLARCRVLLGLPEEAPRPPKKTAQELMLELTGVDLSQCPCCNQGTMRIVAELLTPSFTDLNCSRGPP